MSESVGCEIDKKLSIQSLEDLTMLVASALPHLKKMDKLEFGLALLKLYHTEVSKDVDMSHDKGINMCF
jgi:hypothetical protein